MLDRPRLIVFSRNADDRLWAEVLNLGGFDLLATPFREEEFVFAIGSAWLDWEREKERRRLRKCAHAERLPIDLAIGAKRPRVYPMGRERLPPRNRVPFR
jgi:hypothetical protein